MAIRILHVVEALGVGGGVENGIANLIDRMDSSRFDHVLCAVFHLGSLVDRYPADRVRLMCLKQKPRRFSVQVGPLAEVIRQVKPDIVHSRNWGALEAVFAGRLARSPSVIHSEHGVELEPSAEPRRRRVFRRLAFQLADRVFSVSYHLRDMLAQRTGFPARKIDVIHNGVDTKRFRNDAAARRQFRSELGISEQEFCIGCVGRLNSIKDYPTMLRGVEVFANSSMAWRLLIAGSGAELPRLEKFIDDRPALRHRVRFLGSSNRIPEFLNAMDVYVLPSLCEGISNSLLEAMATGLPVIASETGGNPELIVNGQSGLLFPIGDYSRLAEQLLLLCGHKLLRQELGRNALARVREHFSLNSMVERYETMYTTLAGEPIVEHVDPERELCRSES